MLYQNQLPTETTQQLPGEDTVIRESADFGGEYPNSRKCSPNRLIPKGLPVRDAGPQPEPEDSE